MDWETQPFNFVLSIVVTAAVGALASGYKTINGEGLRWGKMSYRWLYRAVNGTAAGLIIATITADLRILWAAVLVISVSGFGEDKLMEMLPFKIDKGHERPPANREDD